MSRNEAVRTVDEIDQDERVRQRMTVIREFIEEKTGKRSASPGLN